MTTQTLVLIPDLIFVISAALSILFLAQMILGLELK